MKVTLTPTQAPHGEKLGDSSPPTHSPAARSSRESCASEMLLHQQYILMCRRGSTWMQVTGAHESDALLYM